MGTSEICVERVQALLKVDTGDGSLHDHLVRLSRKLAEEKPGEALAQLETLSRHLKRSNFRGAPAPDESSAIVHDAAAREARLKWCGDIMKLTRQPSDPTAAPRVLGFVQNFLEDSAMFRWAGIGFGQQESYHIGASLRKLASDTPSIESLRFWGKILGTEADYLVAEGTLRSLPKAAPAEGEEKPLIHPDSPEFDVEPKGEGANTFTYWVSEGGCAAWVRLPAARASHIVAARSIKRMLTGRLEAPVLSNPWYPGKERHLLRAQIARISATCMLAPTGWYEEDADAGVPGQVRQVEEPAIGSPEDMASNAGWCHRLPCITKIGRCTFPEVDALSGTEPPMITEERAKTISAQIEAEGELKGTLTNVESDLSEAKAALPEGEEADNVVAWTYKVSGDKCVYNEKSHQVIAARSNLWPGAAAVTQGSKFGNIYIGYALKCGTLIPLNPQNGLPLVSGTDAFCPLVNDDIMEEPEDLEEQEEPNPVEDDVASEGGSIEEAEEES